MLGRAAEGGRDRGAVSGEALRDSLMADGLLPEEESGAPADEHLGWGELARDVKRLREAGVRIPHGPLPAADHEAACEARFGQRAPASHPGALRRRDGEPTLIDACLLLADLSGPLPESQAARPARSVKASEASLRRDTHGPRAKQRAAKRRPRKHP